MHAVRTCSFGEIFIARNDLRFSFKRAVGKFEGLTACIIINKCLREYSGKYYKFFNVTRSMLLTNDPLFGKFLPNCDHNCMLATSTKENKCNFKIFA